MLGDLTPQMEALAIDAACTATSRLLRHITVLFIGGVSPASGRKFDQGGHLELVGRLDSIAVRAHEAAAPVHGLFTGQHPPFRAVPRNSPCLCGSGEKAKKCHGVPVRAE